jgi:hypothetical protein
MNPSLKIYWKQPGWILPVFCWVCCSLVFIIGACAPQQTISTGPAESLGIQSILIAPFQNIALEQGIDKSIRCSLCGQVAMTGVVSDEAPSILASRLMSLLQPLSYTLVPGEDVQTILSGMNSGKTTMPSELERYVQVGKQKGVDAVLVGHIFRYTERVGNRYSVQTPASVEFDLHLIRISDERIVWVDHFDETQQALMDNLMKAGSFFKRGGTWITAEQLAFSGLDNMIERFPRP